MAVRVPPQRRHPDDETRLCERACRTRCSATADRADRARRGTAHEADLRRLLGAVAQSPASVSRVRNLVGLRDCGRKRLLPAFGERPLGELSLDAIRGFVAELADEVEAGELAAKTLNNALGTLVVCLNSAVEDGVLAVNPALRVQRLPPGHIERDYLRLDEIPRYLDACSDVYRPLAELLVGSGLRISEALALRIGDLELEETGGAIVVYRSRKGSAVGSTKSDRFRSVEIGPGLSPVLQDQVARGAEVAAGDPCDGRSVHHADSNCQASAGPVGERGCQPTARPDRGLARLAQGCAPGRRAARYAAARAPPHGRRCVARGRKLTCTCQLGHADIGTTERYCGHLERHVLAAGAIATEDAIARAALGQHQRSDC
jgi:integrase